MDPATIAAALVTIFRPFLKGFLKGVQGTSEEVGEQVGGKLHEFALGLWHKIQPHLESRSAAAEAAEDVASDPDNEDAAAALRVQLKKLLEEDPDLVRDLSSSLEEAQQAGTIADVVIYGGVHADHGGVAAGRDIQGGVRTGVPPENPV